MITSVEAMEVPGRVQVFEFTKPPRIAALRMFSKRSEIPEPCITDGGVTSS